MTKEEILARIDERLGRVHARQRLGIESDHEAQIFGQGINFFHPENWYSVHAGIRTFLKVTGLYWRGKKNTERITIRHNYIEREDVPSKFEGFTILQLSDLHADMNPGPMRRLVELLSGVEYDVCVLTGDYRGKTFGPFDAALEGVALVRSHLKETVYGVLGNHDTIQMAPGLEEMGIRMLLNESETITLDGQRIHFAGIDDAHYYRADNIQNAASRIPQDEFSILLSHTPEIYRQAAHADFKLLLSGHTHGGQVCLPGSIPITLDAVLPRHMGRGSWNYHNMSGYTSVGVGSSIVAVRFNCPPEITLHHLQRTPFDVITQDDRCKLEVDAKANLVSNIRFWLSCTPAQVKEAISHREEAHVDALEEIREDAVEQGEEETTQEKQHAERQAKRMARQGYAVIARVDTVHSEVAETNDDPPAKAQFTIAEGRCLDLIYVGRGYLPKGDDEAFLRLNASEDERKARLEMGVRTQLPIATQNPTGKGTNKRGTEANRHGT